MLSPLLPFRGGCRRSDAIRILERVFSVPPFNYRLSAASRLTIGSLTGWGLVVTTVYFFCLFCYNILMPSGGLAGFFVRCPMLSSGSHSLVSSRTLVAPPSGFSPLPLSAPWFRVVVGHALAFGAARWRLRRSVGCRGRVCRSGRGFHLCRCVFGVVWGGVGGASFRCCVVGCFRACCCPASRPFVVFARAAAACFGCVGVWLVLPFSSPAPLGRGCAAIAAFHHIRS